MFETKKVEKRISDLVQRRGTDFLADEKVFQSVINDILPDLKLERTVLINATSVNVGKILLAAQGLSQEEKRKAANKVKDKLLNEAAFSEDGANFVVTVLSTALGWNKVEDEQEQTASSPPNPSVAAVSHHQSKMPRLQERKEEYSSDLQDLETQKTPKRHKGIFVGVGLLVFFLLIGAGVFVMNGGLNSLLKQGEEWVEPVVNPGKVFEIFDDSVGTRWVDSVENYNTAIEKGIKPKPLAFASTSEIGAKPIGGNVIPVGIVIFDSSAFEDKQDSTKTTQARSTGTVPAVQTTIFNFMGRSVAYAEDDVKYPCQNWEQFQTDFYEAYKRDLPDVNVVPDAFMNEVSATRAVQLGTDFSHKGDHYFVMELSRSSGIGENIAEFRYPEISGAELYAAWKSSPKHYKILQATGADAVFYGLGVSESPAGTLHFSFNSYESSAKYPVTSPSHQKGLELPEWYIALTVDKSDEESEIAIEITPAPTTEEEISIRESEPIEIEPGGIAGNLEDAIRKITGDEDIDTSGLENLGSWPENQLIDISDIPSVPISDKVKNDIAVGDDILTNLVDTDKDGWADEADLKSTNGITNDNQIIGLGCWTSTGELRVSVIVKITPAWWNAAEAYVNSLIESNNPVGARGVLDTIIWYQNTCAPNDMAFIEKIDTINATITAAEKAKIEAEAQAAREAEVRAAREAELANKVQVPNFIGLYGKGTPYNYPSFNFTWANPVETSAYEEGRIISQSIAPGTMVAPGTTIHLTVAVHVGFWDDVAAGRIQFYS